MSPHTVYIVHFRLTRKTAALIRTMIATGHARRSDDPLAYVTITRRDLLRYRLRRVRRSPSLLVWGGTGVGMVTLAASVSFGGWWTHLVTFLLAYLSGMTVVHGMHRGAA